MKVFLVINTPDFFLSHRLNIALELKRLGNEVSIVTSHSHLEERIKNLGFGYLAVPFVAAHSSIISEFRCIWSLFQLYRRERPDVVHQVTIKPILYGSIAGWVLGVPRVINAISGLGHVFIDQSLKIRFLRVFIIYFYRFFLTRENVQVIFQNKDDLQFFLRNKMAKAGSSCLIKGAGVCMNTFSLKENSFRNKVHVVLPARMLWEKGVGEFVKAVEILHKKDIQADFSLIGGRDPKNPSCVPEETLLNWRDNGIRWLGHQEDMVEQLQNSDIVCLPSYREGLPKVLVEAAACGKPIVTTDVPGCREVIEDGVTGILVPVKNPEKLAIALQKLILDHDLRIRMGLAARKFIENEFSNDAVVKKTLELYGV